MHELNKSRYLSRILRTDPGELWHIASHALATLRFRYLKRCVGRGTVVEEGATIRNTIVWPNGRIAQAAVLDGPILGRNCHIGRNVTLSSEAVIGDRTAITDYTRL